MQKYDSSNTYIVLFFYISVILLQIIKLQIYKYYKSLNKIIVLILFVMPKLDSPSSWKLLVI